MEPTRSLPDVPILDAHLHLWDLSRFRLPWLEGAPRLRRSFSLDDFRTASAGLNVVEAIYMEVDVAPEQHVLEAETALALCAREDTPLVAAVIGGRPAAPDFEAYLDRFAGNARLVGVRQVLHGPNTPSGECLRPEFVRGIRCLGERGLRFDLCIRSAELPDAARLLDACPETQFVLDHCGNPAVQSTDRSRWERDLAEVARRPNVACKISGIVASARPGDWSPADLAPFVRHALEVFGPDRVLFGGDWPVCTLAASYRQWVEALWEILRGLPAPASAGEERMPWAALFRENARRWYGLDGAPSVSPPAPGIRRG